MIEYNKVGTNYLVSTRYFNFISCYGSQHLTSFKFYVKPFDSVTWLVLLYAVAVISGIMTSAVGLPTKVINVSKILEGIFLFLVLYASMLEQNPCPNIFPFVKSFKMSFMRRLVIFWLVMVMTLTGIYKGIIVSDLTAPTVDSNPIESFWNLTNFKIFTPGNNFRRK